MNATALLHLPLTVIPLVLFNVFGWDPFGAGDPWAVSILTIQMLSGAAFTLTSGDLLLLLAVVLLYVEILKATRSSAGSLFDHLVSMLVFIVFLVEFLAVRFAAHPVFFLLLAISFVDVVAGFSVTIRSARRDVEVERTY